MAFVAVRMPVIMPAAAGFLRMVVRVVVAAVFVIMIMPAGAMLMGVVVTMVMAACTMLVVVAVIMAAAFAVLVCMVVTAILVIVVVMRVAVIMAFAARILSPHGEQIEEAQHGQTDAGHQHHRTEDAIRWQVVRQTTADVEVKQHAAPQKEHGDAEEVNEGAGSTHGSLGFDVKMLNQVHPRP